MNCFSKLEYYDVKVSIKWRTVYVLQQMRQRNFKRQPVLQLLRSKGFRSANAEKSAASLSCADIISGWSAKHRSFLDENGLELISVFKGDFALAKSVGKDEFSVIKGENAPEIVSTAELEKSMIMASCGISITIMTAFAHWTGRSL